MPSLVEILIVSGVAVGTGVKVASGVAVDETTVGAGVSDGATVTVSSGAGAGVGVL